MPADQVSALYKLIPAAHETPNHMIGKVGKDHICEFPVYLLLYKIIHFIICELHISKWPKFGINLLEISSLTRVFGARFINRTILFYTLHSYTIYKYILSQTPFTYWFLFCTLQLKFEIILFYYFESRIDRGLCHPSRNTKNFWSKSTGTRSRCFCSENYFCPMVDRICHLYFFSL